MKILLTLFLFFILSGCEQNYIKDFKIDGIGLGDSLLDKFSKDEILENQRDYYPETKFITSLFLPRNINSKYAQYSADYNRNDSKYLVQGISGQIYFDEKSDFMKKCILKRKEIIENLSTILKISEWKNSKFDDDEGDYDQKYIFLESGENITVSCYDWNEATESKLNYVDYLGVEIQNKQVSQMLTSRQQ